MSVERDIRILEHNIAEIDRKLLVFNKQEISEKKKEKLIALKAKYQAQLDEINGV